jgi:DNA modification methylase
VSQHRAGFIGSPRLSQSTIHEQGNTMTASTFTTTNAANLNTVLQGDCVQIMRQMQSGSVDFVITDPPYITRYCDRSSRSVANDDNARWLNPTLRIGERWRRFSRGWVGASN